MRTKVSEFKAGFLSGLAHDPKDPLCVFNLLKMASGLKAVEPLVKYYWRGYQSGLKLKGGAK